MDAFLINDMPPGNVPLILEMTMAGRLFTKWGRSGGEWHPKSVQIAEEIYLDDDEREIAQGIKHFFLLNLWH